MFWKEKLHNSDQKAKNNPLLFVNQNLGDNTVRMRYLGIFL